MPRLPCQVLMCRCAQSQSQHVLGDPLDLLTPSMREKLEALTPDPEADDSTKYAAYEEMGRVMAEDNYRSTFLDAPKCMCCEHLDGAPLSAMDGHDVGSGDPICVWVAGSTCTDFSVRGKTAKSAGQTMLLFKVWGALVKARRPDIVLHEITPSAAARSMIRKEFSDLYSIGRPMPHPTRSFVAAGVNTPMERHSAFTRLTFLTQRTVFQSLSRTTHRMPRYTLRVSAG